MEKTPLPSKSPKSPGRVLEKETQTRQESQKSGLTPDRYEPKPFDLVKDLKTGRHAIVKARQAPKPPAATSKPPQVKWDPERKAWVRKHKSARPQTHDEEEMKIATSPKKRVVSDSHWRNDRSASNTPQKPDTKPQYVSISDLKPRKVVTQKSMPDFRQKSTPSKPTPTAVWATRRPAAEKSKWTTWDPSKDPIYQATVARQRSRSRSRERHGDSSSVNVRHAAPRKNGHTTPQKDHRRESTVPNVLSDPGKFRQGRHRYFDESHNVRREEHFSPESSPSQTEDIFSLASPGPDDSISRVDAHRPLPTKPKGPLQVPRKLSKEQPTKQTYAPPQMYGKNGLTAKEADVAPVGAPVFTNRIQSWLGGQHDPFWDETITSPKDRSIPSPIPEPLRPRKREQKTVPSHSREPLRSSGQARQFSFEHEDESQLSGPNEFANRDKENAGQERQVSNGNMRKSSLANDHRGNNSPRLGLGIGLGIDMDSRRDFPSTGKPLSTIASVVTQDHRSTGRYEASIVADSHAGSTISLTTIGDRGQDRKTEPKAVTGLKRRLTKHDDLMSVLSAPRETPSLISARSFQTHRSKLENITLEGTLRSLAEDERTYHKELHALVDGIIPTLLSNVLSKSGASASLSLYDKDGKRTSITQPIVDMGVALERLKTHHKRMQPTNATSVLMWAQNASRIYDDYINAWRMGFNDVIINIPAGDKAGWHEGLTRNVKGDLINGKGERVDIAFLLKRPLVRVKNLAKTFRVCFLKFELCE